MQTIALAFQIVIALGIFNVWLLRGKKKTAFRGGQAQNLEEEFLVYGLSRKFMILVGSAKLLLAVLLLLGIAFPEITPVAAGFMAVLMAGAVAMHAKVHDPLSKAAPALVMLCMSLFVLRLTF